MKKILLGAAAAIAIAAPGVAAADTNAVVGLGYSNTDFDSFDFDRYGFTGAFSHDLSNGAVLQMDGEMGRVDAGGCCIGSSYGAVHYGWRTDTHSFGGFIGLTDSYVSGLGIGIEGQMFLGNLNLNGSVGYVDYDDAEFDATNVEVDAAYFFTPNLALTGVVAYSEADVFGGDTDWTTLGIGGEWRFDNSPFSVNAGYRNHDFDGGEADTWTIGFSWDLGTGSVQDRTRSGPGFGGARQMFDALSPIFSAIP